MNKWTTKRGTRIFRTTGKSANSYLIKNENITVLIDTGRKSYYDYLKKCLSEINGGIKKIDYLILTHTHYDHSQNASSIKNDYGAKVIVHRQEADFLRNGYTPLPAGTGPLFRFLAGFAKRFLGFMATYQSVEPDIEIDGDFALSSEPDISIIETGGHTKGSVSVIVDDEIALVGDTAFGVFKDTAFPPFANDVKQLMKSWERLLRTNCTLFLPGHGKPFSRQLLESNYEHHKSTN